ncbi:phosphohistidine phosphatase SixA [Candidatus Micrarchaeota archaeon]|nr:phosphohistidine phosphatase SixA [Candidatus Micrarchaeota archaeon]
MEFYLIQHADAKPEEEDPERPLSDKGKEEAERVAEALGKVGIRAKHIMHSGKLRAQQTAEIFAKHFGPSEVREMLGLKPNDNPLVAKTFLESAREPVALVGHMPHLSKLASLLITGNPEQETIQFHMGGAVCLSKDEKGEKDNKWRLKWAVTPEITPFPIKELFPMGSERRNRAAGRTWHREQ